MGKCKKCGVEVRKEAMFCPNCGAGVSKEASVEKLSGGKGRRKKKYAMIGGGIGAMIGILLMNGILSTALTTSSQLAEKWSGA